MGIRNIGSLFLPVQNLERSISFYTEVLGLVCRGVEDWGGGSRGATLFCNPHPEQGAMLSLAEVEEPVRAMQRPILSLNCSEAAALHEELQARGCRISELETWDTPWNHHLLFDVFDPDGHMIALIEMVPISEGTEA